MKSGLVLAIAAGALAGAGATGGYWLALQRSGSANVATVSAARSAAPDRKPLYYHDPMYPQQKFDKPGKSPFMDMMLVPVYESDGAEPGSVRVGSRVVQNFGIRTAEVVQGKLDRDVSVVGTVAFDERAVAVVQARVAGYIEKLYVRAPLVAVAKGQPFAEIIAPDWAAAQEEYLAVRNSPTAGASLRQAARQRLLVLGMDESAVAALEATGKTRARVTLAAPIGGLIGELAAREGMTVVPGTPLARINGLSTVWVNAEVPEAQVAGLVPDTPVSITVAAYPGQRFAGRVLALLPDVSVATRTLKARIEAANPDGRLVPGMFATVAASRPAAADALLVPSEAVIRTGRRAVVIVAGATTDAQQQFAPVDVETGAESNGMTEIRKGLSRGMKVVVSGQFLIDSEASLKAATTRMGDAPSPAPQDVPAGEKTK